MLLSSAKSLRPARLRFFCAPPDPNTAIFRLQDDLRMKDQDLRMLQGDLRMKDQDLRTKDQDLRTKDQDLRTLQQDLRMKYEDLRMKCEDLLKYMERTVALELERKDLVTQVKNLHLQVLRLVYQMKVRGILEIFVKFAKAKLVEKGVKFSGNYPFLEILSHFPELKACLIASSGRSKDNELVQSLYSFLTYANGLHHPVFEEGETLVVLRQYFDVNVYGRMLLCIGEFLSIKIVFTDEQVEVRPEAKATKVVDDDDVQGGVGSDTKTEE